MRVRHPSRYEYLLPSVSAITPVGMSQRTIPTVKNALAPKASVLLKPASSKKRVLTPQINEFERVLRRFLQVNRPGEPCSTPKDFQEPRMDTNKH